MKAKDNAENESITCTFTVSIEDSEPPKIEPSCPSETIELNVAIGDTFYQINTIDELLTLASIKVTDDFDSSPDKSIDQSLPLVIPVNNTVTNAVNNAVQQVISPILARMENLFDKL